VEKKYGSMVGVLGDLEEEKEMEDGKGKQGKAHEMEVPSSLASHVRSCSPPPPVDLASISPQPEAFKAIREKGMRQQKNMRGGKGRMPTP